DERGVAGQDNLTLHDVVRFTGWNVDSGSEDHCCSSPVSGRAREREAKGRLVLLGLAGGVIVNLNDNVGAAWDRARIVIDSGLRHRAGRPTADKSDSRYSRTAETGITAVRARSRSCSRRAARV